MMNIRAINSSSGPRRGHAVDALSGQRQRELAQPLRVVQTRQRRHAIAVATGHRLVELFLDELGDCGGRADAEHDAGAHLVAEDRAHALDGEAASVQGVVGSPPVLEGETVTFDVEPRMGDDLPGLWVHHGCGVRRSGPPATANVAEIVTASAATSGRVERREWLRPLRIAKH